LRSNNSPDNPNNEAEDNRARKALNPEHDFGVNALYHATLPAKTPKTIVEAAKLLPVTFSRPVFRTVNRYYDLFVNHRLYVGKIFSTNLSPFVFCATLYRYIKLNPEQLIYES
jgi:hypothetical protein